ncbi:MAG: superoxide dismutase family protein [Gammaproteobacteria bacterium]|nr:superoxide dismutase family protein [Gammaproteobacteria bacterium]
MKMLASVVTILLLGLVPLAAPAAQTAKAVIIDVEGNTIGEALVQQAPTGVLIFIDVTGLPPGPHAIHIHSVGKCEPNFKASKGHINPHKRKHGLLNPNGPDRGDLPNVFVSLNGTLNAELFTTRVRLKGGSAPLLDADGSAFVIHERRDDHMAQPIGGAGGRIACGVIEAP